MIALDSSLARNKRMFATSSGIHTGTDKFMCFLIWPNISGCKVAGSVFAIGVAMVLGFTELQRIPVPAKRSAV